MHIFFVFTRPSPAILDSLLSQPERIFTKALNGVLEMPILLGSKQKSVAKRGAFTQWVDKVSSNPRFAA
jgi:hypothetical protein